MKILFTSALISSFVTTAVAQQQSPFTPPPTAPSPAPGTPAGQTTTPANQGVASNPTGDALTGNPSIVGATNMFGQPVFGAVGTNQSGTNQPGGGATAPLFLSVTPTPITDANGQLLGNLQQIVLNPAGSVQFGVINSGGRLVPVPWQLIMTSATPGRAGLALNADNGVFRTAPPVAVGQIPLLVQDDIQQRILGHFGAQNQAAQPTVVTTGTARGGTGGAGVTLTGGSTNTVGFNTNSFSTTNRAAMSNNNNINSNQAVNTTGGLLSPTGQTNGIRDPYNPNRQNQPAATTPNQPAPPPAGQPGAQPNSPR